MNTFSSPYASRASCPTFTSPAVSHIGVAGIAHVGVVLPDNGLTFGAVELQQAVEGFGHVPVADVPGVELSANHSAVVPLTIQGYQGVLLGYELILRSEAHSRW